MSQIPPVVASIAQSQLTQKQQAARNDATRESSSRSAAEARRKAEESREFVEDMAEATGLKVDEDGAQQQESKAKRRLAEMMEESESAGADPVADADAARSHAAALLADPDENDPHAPPPCMIDVEA
jgi:hypothetical protein